MMRAVRYAAWVAGAVCLHGTGALAGESSSLRGLKPPSSAFENRTLTYAPAPGQASLRRTGDEPLSDWSPRLSLAGGTYESRRVTTQEADFRFGLHQPTGQNVQALAEPSIHSLQDALPRYTLHSQYTRYLPGGWGLGFGVRQTEYNFSTSSLISLSAGRQWGNVRGAYTMYTSRAEGAGLGSAHRFELSYLYGERNTIGLSYTTGRDIDAVGVPAGFVLNDARDWSLSGRHWLTPNWALTYDVLSQEQALRRPGLRFGVSRSF